MLDLSDVTHGGDLMRFLRVIPVLLFDDGAIYRSQQFTRHYRLGNPLQQLDRYKAWDVDEVIYIDMHLRPNGRRLLEFLPAIARNCFAPLAVGGGIRTLEDIHQRLDSGADRVIINTAAVTDPQFITEAAQRYGAQAIIVSIDALARHDGTYEVVVDSGRRPTGKSVAEWASEAAARGAGEIFLNSIDRDGMGQGYDVELMRAVASRISIPLIACGGVGTFEHLVAGIRDGGASSVAAANIFCFKELGYFAAKDALAAAGIPVRPSETAPRRHRSRSG
jgi:imidazoleglycerol phosphate synthase cyclase subunit